jgi:hypothetical protein
VGGDGVSRYCVLLMDANGLPVRIKVLRYYLAQIDQGSVISNSEQRQWMPIWMVCCDVKERRCTISSDSARLKKLPRLCESSDHHYTNLNSFEPHLSPHPIPSFLTKRFISKLPKCHLF